MSRPLALIAVLIAGGLLAAQPPVNAQLSKHVGGMGAVFVSLVTSTLVVGVAVLATGSGSRLGEVIRVSPVYLTGGLIGAVYLAIALFAVGSLGAGGVVAATVTTQLVCAALLDRLGVLGLSQVGLTPTRLLGFGLLLAGTALITLR